MLAATLAMPALENPRQMGDVKPGNCVQKTVRIRLLARSAYLNLRPVPPKVPKWLSLH